MARSGGPSAARKRNGESHFYPVTRAELVDGTVLESNPYVTRDGTEMVGSLLWDGRNNGLRSYDADGNTFYPASQVRLSRFDYPPENEDD